MEKITVEALVNAPRAKAWEVFTDPEQVKRWNHASDDWHSPKAENDLRVGSSFNFRMEAKDGSAGFDFTGVYDEVVPEERIAYTMEDGRKVATVFSEEGGATRVVTTFDAESENPVEMQRAGWQAILENYKKCTESA